MRNEIIGKDFRVLPIEFIFRGIDTEYIMGIERLYNVAVIPTNVETYGLCIVEPFCIR